MNIKIDISKKLRPFLKSVRGASRAVKVEATKAFKEGSQVLRDIESGKLSIIATLRVTKRKL